MEARHARDLPSLLRAGDLVVVNDAPTLPASIKAPTSSGAPVELRLVASRDSAHVGTAALLGAGDWRTRTEDRPPPPLLDFGDRLHATAGLVADVVGRHDVSPRLVDLRFGVEGGDG